MGKRGFLLFFASALGLVVFGTRCDGACAGVHEGKPCYASQVGLTCADPDAPGCNSLVCDGAQFGPKPAVLGDTCTQAGLVCSPSTGPCPQPELVCDGNQFALQGGVGPGVACSQAGVTCRWPDLAECSSCTCDGTKFQCVTPSCVMDAGPPKTCPFPQLVVEGQSCTATEICAGSSACDSGSSACSCVSGTWSCQCVTTPVVLATGEDVSKIASDGAYVYWTDWVTNRVRRIAVGGGTTETIATGQSAPSAIAVDATSVYWLNTGSSGGVMKLAIGGGTPVVLASNAQLPGFMAVDATNVYWTNDATLMTVPISGGTPVTLATVKQPMYGIAIDTTNVYWSTVGEIDKVPLGGGASTTVTYAAPGRLAVDATSLYWADPSGVAELSLSGGTATILSAGSPYDLAVDANAAYWVDYNGGSVMKVALTGGAPVVLAIGQVEPAVIALDATNVYWTSGGDVMMTPK